MVHLDNAKITSDFRRRAIKPQNTSHVDLLTQHDTSGKFYELEHGVHIPPSSHILESAGQL